MPTTYNVKLGLTRLTSAALVEKGRNNVIMLTGNGKYITPTPALAEITTACDVLEAANLEVAFNGGKLAFEAKRLAVIVLENLIKDLAGYVRGISEGDKASILSAGFEVRKQPETKGVLPAPTDLGATISEFTGCIETDWKLVDGARMYQLWMTEGDPTLATGWVSVSLSTKTSATVKDLKTGKIYSFRVNAINAAGPSPMSETATALAA